MSKKDAPACSVEQATETIRTRLGRSETIQRVAFGLAFVAAVTAGIMHAERDASAAEAAAAADVAIIVGAGVERDQARRGCRKQVGTAAAALGVEYKSARHLDFRWVTHMLTSAGGIAAGGIMGGELDPTVGGAFAVVLVGGGVLGSMNSSNETADGYALQLSLISNRAIGRMPGGTPTS